MPTVQLQDGRKFNVPDTGVQQWVSMGAKVLKEPATFKSTLHNISNVVEKPLKFGADIGAEMIKMGGRAVLAPIDMIQEGLGRENVTEKIPWLDEPLTKKLERQTKEYFKQTGEYLRTGDTKGIGSSVFDLTVSYIEPTVLFDFAELATLNASLKIAGAAKIAKAKAKLKAAQTLEDVTKRLAQEAVDKQSSAKRIADIKANVKTSGNKVIIDSSKADVDLRVIGEMKDELGSVNKKIVQLQDEGVRGANDLIKIDDLTPTNGVPADNVLDLRVKQEQKILKARDTQLNDLLKKKQSLIDNLNKKMYNVNEGELDLYSKPVVTNISTSAKAPNKVISEVTGMKTDKFAEKLLKEAADSIDNNASKSMMKKSVQAGSEGGDFWHRHFVSIADTFEKMGQAGKLMIKKIYQAADKADAVYGQFMVGFKTTLKDAIKNTNYSKKELGPLVSKYLENGLSSGDKYIDDLVDYAREVNKIISDRAVAQNVLLKAPDGTVLKFEAMDNFFPHMYDSEKMLKTFRKSPAAKTKYIEDIAKANDVTFAEAETIFNKYISYNADRYVGSLQHARTANLPGYRTDIGALPDYWNQSITRLSEIEQFGNFDEVGDFLIKRIGDDGGNHALAKNMYDTVVGRDKANVAGNKILSRMRKFHSVSLLSPSTAVLQFSQLAPAMQKFGIFNTLGELAKSAIRPGKYKNFAMSKGTLLNTAREMANTTGGFAELYLNKLSGIGYVDNFIRGVSTSAAKNWTDDLIKKLSTGKRTKFVQRELAKIKTIDAEKIIKSGTATQAEKDSIIKYLVDKTQVRARSFELPVSWSSETGKTLTQLKSFTFGMQRYLKEEIWHELKRGNAVPLVKLGIASGLTGEVIADIRGILTNKKRPDEIGERLLDNWTSTLTLGFLFEVGMASQYGEGALTGAVAGPSVSFIGQSGNALWQLLAEQNPDPIFKLMLRRFPGIGPTLQGYVYPSKNSRQ